MKHNKPEKWGNIRVSNTLISYIKNAIEKNGKFSSVSDFVNYVLEKQLNQGDSHFKNILSEIKRTSTGSRNNSNESDISFLSLKSNTSFLGDPFKKGPMRLKCKDSNPKTSTYLFSIGKKKYTISLCDHCKSLKFWQDRIKRFKGLPI